MRHVTATRYVTALREGGSLPGLVEGDDDGLYVVKFRGAGQGEGTLVAEVVAGEIARALGLPVPELVTVEVPPELGHAEPDPEIQELIAASPGLNAGMDFLPGALPFNTGGPDAPGPDAAARIVWFDWLVTNIDRTPRNPNLLTWHGSTWLIDHGAAFFRQHGNDRFAEAALRPVPRLKEHVLLPGAGSLTDAGAELEGPARAAVEDALALVPDEWLGADPGRRRAEFASFLAARLDNQPELLAELRTDDRAG
jgi:hypothetical protein